MALRHFLYGDHEPTPVHQIMTGIIVISFILAVYGLLAPFVPDQGWTQGGGFFAVSLLAILVIGAKAIDSDDRRQRFYVSTSSTFETLLAGSVRSVFYLSVLWLAFVHGFAALYTASFGHHYQAEMTVTKQHAAYSGACDYQITSPDLHAGATQYLCISREQYFRWPSSLRVRMDGRASVLGRTVSDLSEAPVNTPSP